MRLPPAARRGYLTASSARVFGTALYRQFVIDHATAGYATSPLFAGVRIALAGTHAAGPARPLFPMHTLTVTGINEFNKPDTGDIVLVFNADNPNKFSDISESTNFFFRGVAKFSVPAGHYWAIAIYLTAFKNRAFTWPPPACPPDGFAHPSGKTGMNSCTHRLW